MGEGRVFVSYRRSDTQHVAGRLFDRLEGRYGAGNVFMDVASIEPGLDFSEAVIDAVGQCDALLALIGPGWVGSVDGDGRRRLHDPDDWVALEIVVALRRGIRVIPVLVDEATPPRRDDLPEVLAPLVTRQAVRLDHTGFNAGVTALIAVLDPLLERARSEPAPPAAPASPLRLLGTLRGHTDTTDLVAFSPDNRRLVSAGADGTAKLWDVANGALLHTLTGHRERPAWVAFSRDGRLLGTADWASALIRNPYNGRPQVTVDGHDAWVEAQAFSPSGHILATAGADGTARLWSTATGAPGPVLSGHADSVEDVAFSPDGALVGTVSTDRTARLWDPVTGASLRVLECDGEPWRVTFSPDGRLVAAAGGLDTAVQVWDLVTGEERFRLGESSTSASDLVFSPDSRLLVTRATYTVRIWDMADGGLRHELTAHTAQTQAIAFRPDGRLLATAGMDTTIRLWDPATGASAGVLTGHTEGVCGLAFSPDGTLLASTGADTTVRVWH